MASILNVILRLTGQNAGASTAIMQVHDALELAGMAAQAFQDSAGKLVAAGIGMNSMLETTTLQFGSLGLSADDAQKHVQDLFQIAKATPFETGPIIEASRSLRVMGGAALDTHDNLLMVGDAAAATSSNIQDVAFWTGRAYSAIQAGRPFGEAAQRLQELAVLSPQARNEIERLQKAGADSSAVWKVLTDDLNRFGGAMEKQAGTWKGLTSTMSDTIGILAGTATHESFLRLEDDLKRINAALSDPRAQRNAETLGTGLAAGVDVTAATVEAGVTRMLGPIDDFNRVWTDTGNLVENRGALIQAVIGGDLPRAFDTLRESLVETQTDVSNVTDAFSRHADAARTASAAMAAMVPIQNQVRDAWQEEAHAADEAALSYRGVRDEMERIGAQQPILNQERQAAHDAEMQRLYDEGQALAHAGDINQIVAQEQISAQQFATKQAEQAAKDAAKAQDDAFRAAADAIREKNQQTADAIREAQQASQEAVRRAYGETADEAERAFERVRDAAAPPVDTLSQQLNEAVNRQVREGIAGTADAEKQLDDIRRQHLATLPDLVALDQQYADAQGQVHDADVALAAAQRNLAVALAASGGQQTLQTAALQHGVTAAQAADQAARAHAAALGQEQSQAVSDTNALRGLAAQRASMGGGGGNSLLLPDTGSQARRTTIYGMPFIQPTIVTNHITNNGPVGVDDLGRQITDTVNNGLRNGAVRVPGLATR
jgi:hypothetical protein